MTVSFRQNWILRTNEVAPFIFSQRNFLFSSPSAKTLQHRAAENTFKFKSVYNKQKCIFLKIKCAIQTCIKLSFQLLLWSKNDLSFKSLCNEKIYVEKQFFYYYYYFSALLIVIFIFQFWQTWSPDQYTSQRLLIYFTVFSNSVQCTVYYGESVECKLIL